jgi:chemotaxis protein CheZ
MAVQRKIFRIEQGTGGHRGPDAARDAEAAMRHHEFMTEIRALRSLIEPRPQTDREAMETSRAQIAEAQAYKTELELIHTALRRSRDEIAALGGRGALPPDISRASRELAAIVSGTEQATQQVLQAAEDVDQTANALVAALKSGYEKGLANDIRDRVVQIFEACNFQDLTGQRVGKVVEILAFLEEHVGRLMEIWRGIEQFKPVVLGETAAACERSLLHGPKLAGDTGHSSQNDIDSLFD